MRKANKEGRRSKTLQTDLFGALRQKLPAGASFR
jgi:hypothetical protein